MSGNYDQLGSSVSICDYILKQQVQDIQPAKVVDFGAGRGKNCIIVREIMGAECFIRAIEGYKKAADFLIEKKVCDKVDALLLEDWIDRNREHYDLAIFGDVLEHLPANVIRRVLSRALLYFKYIIITVPLYDIFQDDSYNNLLEIHRAYITPNFFDKFYPKEKHIIKGDGYTIMNILILSDWQQRTPLRKKIANYIFHCIILLLQPIGLARPFVTFLKKYFIKYKSILR